MTIAATPAGYALRAAVRRYAAEQTTLGVQSATIPVTLPTGEAATALVVLDLVPTPTQEP